MDTDLTPQQQRLAEARRLTDQGRIADAAMDEALALARGSGSVSLLTGALYARAELQLATQRPALAVQTMEELFALQPQPSRERGHVLALKLMSLACEANGEVERALAFYREHLALDLTQNSEAAQRRARELTAQTELPLAMAEERQRVMADIHVGIGSRLCIALAGLERGVVDRTALREVLGDCIADLKITLDSLEPFESDLATLLATLRFRLEPRLLAAGLAIDWCVAPLPALTWLDAPHVLAILRLLQEALMNVVRHARAHRVRVATQRQDSNGRAGVQVTVVDDGVGFEVAATIAASASSANAAGRGLRAMRGQAAAVGGVLMLESAPGATMLTLWLPLRNDAVAAAAMRAGAGAEA